MQTNRPFLPNPDYLLRSIANILAQNIDSLVPYYEEDNIPPHEIGMTILNIITTQDYGFDPEEDDKIMDYILRSVNLRSLTYLRAAIRDQQAARDPNQPSNSELLQIIADGFIDYIEDNLDTSNLHPPAPLLVGIELNPGPKYPFATKSINRANKKLNKKIDRKLGLSRPNKTLVVRSNMARSSSPGSSIKSAYCATLKDPWEHPPIKLGYDTFVPTVLSTAYLRSNFTVNADGSFGLIFVPSATAMVYTNNAGAAVATWTSVNAANLAAVTNQALEGRVVSGGIRLVALFPRTSAPGVLFSGIDVGRTLTSLQTLTPTLISGLPSSIIGIGNSGCRAVTLPIDPDSYAFFAQPVTGYTAANPPWSAATVMAGTGFPAGTVIWYEAILNLELLPVSNASGSGVEINDAPTPDTLSSFFPSASNLINSLRQAIGPASIMDGSLLMLDAASAAGVPYAGSFASAGRAVRSAFGGGRNQQLSLVSGDSQARRGRQSTLMIEEMKDYERL